MTPELLTECGRTLYGQQWQTELARALGVGDRNVRRWAAGERVIPEGLHADLLRITQERVDLLQKLAWVLTEKRDA